MFALRSAPLWLEPGSLEAVRLSLNTPVVDSADLPTGPARAALVVHRDRSGRLGVTVGVRSERGGQVALYTLDEALHGDAVGMAVDAALSFGESLGFLFDDEELERGGRRRALRLWHERFGAEAEPEIVRGGEAIPVPLEHAPAREMSFGEDEPDELVLEELVDQIPLSRFQGSQGGEAPDTRYFGEIDLEGEVASLEPSPALPPSPPTPAGVLSKFRAPPPEPEPAASGADTAPRRARLARVRLVRRVRPQEDSGDHDRILRLLAAF